MRRCGTPGASSEDRTMAFRDLTPLFEPRAVAIVGASDDPTRIGGRPVAYMKRSGFDGAIVPVNPKYAIIQDLPAVARLADAPGPVDLVVVAVAAQHVPQTLDDAAAKGARAAVVFSSGFAELGAEGAARQAALVEQAERLGIRMIGPNALGIYAARSGVCATFASLFERAMPPAGPLAIVSQSGAYGTHLGVLALERGLGISHMITTGNEASVGVADCLAHLAGDPDVSVIACYSEGIADGRAFLEAAGLARAAGKPVVMLKVGRSAEGQDAARSHTASVAGDDRVFGDLVAEAGVLRVDTTEELMEAAYTLSRRPPLAGRRLGIVSVSGGACVLMADAARAAGFELPPMPDAAQAKVREKVPMGAVKNPVDTTGNAINDMSIISIAVRTMLQDGGYDAVAGFFLNWAASPTIGPRLRAAIADAAKGFEDRTLAIAMTASEHRAEFEALGMLVFEDPSNTLRALGRSAWVAEAMARSRSAPVEAGPAADIPERIDEAQASALLARAGVPMVEAHVAADPDAAAAVAERLGGAVALKVLSPDIAHKSDVDGVRLGLTGREAVQRAATEVLEAAARNAPHADVRGVLVAPMVTGGTEIILGGRRDPCFGPVVVVGLGGVFVEIFEDIAIAAAPVAEEDAARMLKRLRGWPLLDGARGRPKADVAGLAVAIARFSEFFAANAGTLSSAEINPLIVQGAGEGVVGLDAAFVRG